MEYEDKQEYKMFETGVPVWKSKDMESYQPIFIIGSIMFKPKWWVHVSNSFFKFEYQIMPTVYAGR